ncbi:armadillo-like helical protein [Stemphylium lycopersici]|nr:armadillo-like helical protein [Stemphylium lycopersici]
MEDVGGWETLQKCLPWVRSLLAFLNKPDPPSSKKLCIITLTRIFFLTREYPTLVREITTPSLTPFVQSALHIANTTSTPVTLLQTILESFNALLPRHPTIFRSYLKQLHPLLARLIAPTPSTKISQEQNASVKYGVSSEVAEAARQIYVQLPHCAPKGTSGEDWTKSVKSIVNSTHQTADRVFRAVIEDWQSTAREAPLANAHAIDDEAQDLEPSSDLPPWVGIFAGAERLTGLLYLIKEYLESPTASTVYVNVGLLTDLISRMFSLTIPATSSKSFQNAVRLNAQVGKEERENLWLLLPDVHVAAAEVLLALAHRSQASTLALDPIIVDQLVWVFGAEKDTIQVRTACYTAIAALLKRSGVGFHKSTIDSLVPVIRSCCDDLLPSEMTITPAKQTPNQGKPNGNSQPQASANADAFLNASKEASNSLAGFAGLTQAAHDLLPVLLTNIRAQYLSDSMRARLDRTAILAQHKEAMVASVLNPPPSKKFGKPAASILPLIARSFSSERDVEGMLRPRMPVIRLGGQDLELDGGEDEEEEEDEEDEDEEEEEEVQETEPKPETKAGEHFVGQELDNLLETAGGADIEVKDFVMADAPNASAPTLTPSRPTRASTMAQRSVVPEPTAFSDAKRPIGDEDLRSPSKRAKKDDDKRSTHPTPPVPAIAAKLSDTPVDATASATSDFAVTSTASAVPELPEPGDAGADDDDSQNTIGAGGSKPTVKVIIRRRASQQASAATRYVPTSPSPPRPPPPSYPWDSHQDDVVVNTVENGQTAQRTGVSHYLHQLSFRDDYEHIGTHPSEDARRRKREDGEADVGAEQDRGEIDDGEGVKQEFDENEDEDEDGDQDPRIDLTKAPIPASFSPSSSKQQYTSKIYKGTTKDPAVFLAIARLVQCNLPYIDWTSALNHIPNLPPGVHAEDVPGRSYEGKGKAKMRDVDDDENVTILFLPDLYHDGRHALGYYTTRPKTSNPQKRVLTRMLFSPCTSAQLQRYGLVTYAPDDYAQIAGRGKGKGKERASEWLHVQSVGASTGRWLDYDVVEDWEEWREAVSVVGRVWEERLGNGDFSLTSFDNHPGSPYAILSHTWTAGEEVTYKDLVEGTGTHKSGYAKLHFCSERAAEDGLEYFWIDSCCIDKTTSEELSTAINSMFNWYKRAAACYVYLTDVSVSEEVTDAESVRTLWEPSFRRSRWFTRGWTLQELLAPPSVEFFSREGKRLGSRISLQHSIHEITGIPIEALRARGQELSAFSVNERMSWAAGRTTSLEEDAIYCLLGIFGVFLSPIYGEGKIHANLRLREQIQKRPRRIDLEAKDELGRTPLCVAAAHGHDTIVQALLSTLQVEVDARDYRRRTPLSWAASNGSVQSAKLLLDTGEVDVNAANVDGWTPLLEAAAHGRDAVVKLLLSTKGVDVQVKDRIGRTPLSLASKHGHGAVVELLLNID